ncbi:MAG: dockerin type I repeat-containing protein [Oscillospiraceae bacterium]|nr:dockerin type I repeat-containing protein [Oscillospiraceae bacterium]
MSRKKLLIAIMIGVFLVVIFNLCTTRIIAADAQEITSNAYTIMAGKNSLDEDVTYITKVTPDTTVSTFKSNIQTSSTMQIYDLSDEAVTADDATIATGMSLKMGDDTQYVIVVTADINADGKLTIADVSRLKVYMVGLTTLDDAEMKAADINYDGNVTAVDLSAAKQLVTGLLQF